MLPERKGNRMTANVMTDKTKALGWSPKCTLADSFGSMTESKSVEMFDLVYQNTADGCAIGFHSHNNTQRSLLNVSRIIHHAESNYLNREIIIDSSLAGMGRGAGNLQTEVLSAYLNDINKACNYNVEELTIASGEYVEPLKSQGEWGYNAMHALTAMKKCHPNFAKYAIELNPSMSIAEFAEFLNKIPNEHKSKCTLKITEKILNM
jgi:4-hydroxy 2-oxovalerate aldolase